MYWNDILQVTRLTHSIGAVKQSPGGLLQGSLVNTLGRVCVLAQQNTVRKYYAAVVLVNLWPGTVSILSLQSELHPTFDPTASVSASLRFLAPQSVKQIDTAVDLRYPGVHLVYHVGISEDEGGSTDAPDVAVGTTRSWWNLSSRCKKYIQISCVKPGGRGQMVASDMGKHRTGILCLNLQRAEGPAPWSSQYGYMCFGELEQVVEDCLSRTRVEVIHGVSRVPTAVADPSQIWNRTSQAQETNTQ